MAGSIGDWALLLPDKHRVSMVQLYTSPDGRFYIAPYGTQDPDPDQPLELLWTEVRYVRSGGEEWP